MTRTHLLLTAVLCSFLSSCGGGCKPARPVMTGEYWKDQAVSQIMPGWIMHAADIDSGGFITNLDGNWNASPDTRKYPSMTGRHLFSFSVAYLMTGDEQYLTLANSAKDFLLNHCLDTVYGGWYDVLNRDGSPAATSKNMFIQTYALTGLSMYYFVTHDREVLKHIETTDSLLMSAMWDNVNGGFYNSAERDWQIVDSNKSFASELAPVSGYLINLGLATGDTSYYGRSRRIIDLAGSRMKDPDSGWILEYFDREWNVSNPGNELINTGHNLETAWMILRLDVAEGDAVLLNQSEPLEDSLYRYAFDDVSGFWYDELENRTNRVRSAWSYWWIQAYGNMYSLWSYRATGNPERLYQFGKGAQFWDDFFLDHLNGDTYMSVFNDGTVRDPLKGNQYKTSYHSMEQCLLNYLCLSLWVEKKPVPLWFSLPVAEEGEILYPFPVGDKDLSVIRAEYESSSGLVTIPVNGDSVILPGVDSLKIKVIIKSNNNRRQIPRILPTASD
jgi:mannobiose 2-epimerase